MTRQASRRLTGLAAASLSLVLALISPPTGALATPLASQAAASAVLPPDDDSTLLRATTSAGGPLIEEPLEWTIFTRAPRREVAKERVSGALNLRLPAGGYSVRVVRLADGARATGTFSVPAKGGALVTIGVESTSAPGLEAPREALAGAEIEVAWREELVEDGYIALATFGDPDTLARYDYPVGTLVPPTGLAKLRLPAAPGDYEVRYIADGAPPRVIARRRIAISLGEVGLIAPSTAAAGGDLLVDWFGPANRGDVIAIGAKDLDDRSRRFAYAGAVDTSDGAPARLALPSAPGVYEMRYVADLSDPPAVLARSRIELVDSTATVTAPETAEAGELLTITHDGPAFDHAVIAIVPAGSGDDAGRRVYRASAAARDGRALSLRAPYSPGAYEVRYILERGPRVLARSALQVRGRPYSLRAPSQVQAGGRLEVETSGANGARMDAVVAIARLAAPDAVDPSQYAAASTPQGGLAILDAPAWPGEYEVRLVIVDEGGEHFVAARRQLLVSDAAEDDEEAVTLEAPRIVAAGAPLVVSWRGPGNARDLITLGAAGLRDTAERAEYFAATPADEGELVAFTAPSEAGVYELRYVNEPSGRVYVRRLVEVAPQTP